MLSEDLENMALFLEDRGRGGRGMLASDILASVSVLRAYADVARSLEGHPVPVPLRADQPMPEGVASLSEARIQRSLRRTLVDPGAPWPGGAA